MPHRRWAGLAMAAAVACVCLPGHAQAQLGGLIKKKLKDTVKGEVVGKDSAGSSASGTASAGAGRTTSQPSGPRFNDRVLEMTPATLDKLQAGLQADKAFRDSVETAFARMKSPQEYQQCRMQVTISPEVQQIVRNVDASDMQAAQEASQKMLAVITKRCGPDPSSLNKGSELRKATARAAEAAGLAEEQYDILLERITPFCSDGGGSARIAGSGSNIFYVYSEAEVAALQPRCVKLMALMPGKATGGRRTKG